MSKPIDWETEIIYRGRPLSDYRAAIIEECALYLESGAHRHPEYRNAATAIRALKEKP